MVKGVCGGVYQENLDMNTWKISWIQKMSMCHSLSTTYPLGPLPMVGQSMDGLVSLPMASACQKNKSGGLFFIYSKTCILIEGIKVIKVRLYLTVKIRKIVSSLVSTYKKGEIYWVERKPREGVWKGNICLILGTHCRAETVLQAWGAASDGPSTIYSLGALQPDVGEKVKLTYMVISAHLVDVLSTNTIINHIQSFKCFKHRKISLLHLLDESSKKRRVAWEPTF